MTTMSSRNIIVQKRCHGISLCHCPLNLNICFVFWNKAAEFASWCQWRFVNIIQTVHYCNIRHCVLRREVWNLIVGRALNRNPNTGPKSFQIFMSQQRVTKQNTVGGVCKFTRYLLLTIFLKPCSHVAFAFASMSNEMQRMGMDLIVCICITIRTLWWNFVFDTKHGKLRINGPLHS